MILPALERRVVIFTGCHDKPGHSRAGAFALEMNRKGFEVKLFVESLPGGNLPLGIDINCMMNEEVRKPLDIVRALAALHRLNAFRWSIADMKAEAHRQFLANLISTAQKYGNLQASASSPEVIRAVLGLLSSEYLDAALRISDLGIMSQMEMATLLAISVAPSRRPMPDALLEIGRRMLERIPQADVDDVRHGLMLDIRHFFSVEHGITVPELLRDTNIGQLSGKLLRMRCPLDAKDLVTDLEADLSVLREFSIAYEIARQEFDYGVLSVSMHPFGLPNLKGLLAATGSTIDER
jgi:hypothetical protein